MARRIDLELDEVDGERALADAPAEAPADLLSGVVYSGDGFALCEIVWIDPAPSYPSALAALMDAAADAVEEASED